MSLVRQFVATGAEWALAPLLKIMAALIGVVMLALIGRWLAWPSFIVWYASGIIVGSITAARD